YVNEIHHAAQQGAEFTQALRWFSKRGTKGEQSTPVVDILSSEVRRLEHAGSSAVRLQLDVSSRLPAVRIETNALRILVRQILANAREAIAGPGCVSLSARLKSLDVAECRRVVGNARPGEFVEISVADTGVGFA